MPSVRSRPFSLAFLPSDADAEEPKDASSPRPKTLPVNSAVPHELENSSFKGHILLVHDTGNEPGISPELAAAEPSSRRGVQLQLQGRFKQACASLWVGGELQENLKLGWIMSNVVQLVAKYARKKCEGRVHFVVGSATERPHISFPITQLFTVMVTPPAEVPPVLGSPEVAAQKWQGPVPLSIDTQSIYTLIYKTPYLDLCSWELLKVPGVSPLGLESVLGDIASARVMMYDLERGGTHATWRRGSVLEWFFARGAQGDTWQGDEEPITDQEVAADCLSDASENDEEVLEAEEEEEDGDGVLPVDEQGDAEEESDLSEESGVEEDDEEIIEAMSRADSQALLELEGWRPRNAPDAENTSVRVPVYIEAIDRRRRRKLRVWYVFSMRNPEGDGDWWHAKAATELASLCRPRRRLPTFRRGPGARRYACNSVKTLEQFRHVLCNHLAIETKLRTVVVAATAHGSSTTPADTDVEDVSPPNKLSPSRLSDKVREVRGKSTPLLPPRFFKDGGSTTCALAFTHAREGRNNIVREALCGALHFEGRICEELVRLCSDGIVRCFTPYDCDKPRLRILPSEVLVAERIEGLLLGRFYRWQVQTVLRVLVFCCAEEQERNDWVAAIEAYMSNPSPGTPMTAAMDSLRASITVPHEGHLGAVMNAVQAVPAMAAKVAQVSHIRSRSPATAARRETIPPALPPALASLLMDTTNARRWRLKRRLVLNDRILLADSATSTPSSIAEGILETALSFAEVPPTEQRLIEFMNATCELKAVRVAGWNHNELLSFWLNVYHCLLLHGLLLLGTPKTRAEKSRFHVRVSYLVGLCPVSLWEIEHAILRVPKVDPQDVRAHARARYIQLVSFCGLFRNKGATLFLRPASTGRTSPPTRVSPSQGMAARPPLSPRGEDDQLAKPRSPLCLPMVALPRPPWLPVSGPHACLFLGRLPEPLVPVKQQDLRVVLCLNRGNLSCLPRIPVFHAPALSSELTDMARAFVSEFVQVQERDGRPIRAMLPQCCQAIKRELREDNFALLKFLWEFLKPTAGTPPPRSMQLKFQKYPETPRRLADFSKASYADPNLQNTLGVGDEFEVLQATAQALVRVAVALNEEVMDVDMAVYQATPEDIVSEVSMRKGVISL